MYVLFIMKSIWQPSWESPLTNWQSNIRDTVQNQDMKKKRDQMSSYFSSKIHSVATNEICFFCLCPLLQVNNFSIWAKFLIRILTMCWLWLILAWTLKYLNKNTCSLFNGFKPWIFYGSSVLVGIWKGGVDKIKKTEIKFD